MAEITQNKRLAPVKNILWRVPEYHHKPKTADWYWMFGILGVSGAVACIIIGNALFGVVVILGLFALTLFSFKPPSMLEVEISEKGVRTNKTLLPFNTLEGFWIEETGLHKKLLLKSQRTFMPLIVVPIGNTDTAELRNALMSYLKEEPLKESILNEIMERFGI